MHFYFVIPLIVALISVYFYPKSDEEISYLTGSVTVMSLILGLILAPWELQAGILVLAVVLVRNLWNKIEQQREFNEDIPTIQEENGAANLPTSLTVNGTQDKTERKYRGVTWKKEDIKPIETNPQKAKLKYRGVSQIQTESDIAENGERGTGNGK
jgi:hypothetical protein